MAARLVLLDSDPLRREALVRSLSEIGTFEIAGIATVAETSAVSPPDLYLIEGPSLSANDAGGSIAPNPFAASAIPTVLMLPEPTSEQRRLALRAGYTVVLAAPVPLRLLYRRIAQLLQNARRAKRRGEFSADKRKKQRLEEVSPAQVGLLV
jgi:DNA-binding NarL/FixJ family response regulator